MRRLLYVVSIAAMVICFLIGIIVLSHRMPWLGGSLVVTWLLAFLIAVFANPLPPWGN